MLSKVIAFSMSTSPLDFPVLPPLWCPALFLMLCCYLTNCVCWGEQRLGTNKTCVNSPFQFVSREVPGTPETTNIVRLEQDIIPARDPGILNFRFPENRTWKNEKLYIKTVINFRNFSRAHSSSSQSRALGIEMYLNILTKFPDRLRLRIFSLLWALLI